MNRRRIIIILLAVAVVAAVAFVLLRQSDQSEEPAAEVPADVDAISIDTGIDRVGADGQITPLRHAFLSMPVSGPVAQILVEAGERVAEGDALLRLESADQEIALQQAQAGLAQAEAELASARAGLQSAQLVAQQAELAVEVAQAQADQVKAGPLDEQVAVAELAVEAAEAGISAAQGNQALVFEAVSDAQLLAAQAELEAAREAEKSTRTAYDNASGEQREQLELQLIAAVSRTAAAEAALAEQQRGATSAQRQSATSAVNQAEARREAAQAELDLLEAGAREEQVTVVEVAVRQAEVTQAEAETVVAQAETAVRAAEAGVSQAEAAVDAAQEALTMMTLTAPFAGTVAAVDVEEGEVISPGLPVVTLADFGGWLVKTSDLSELDVVAVSKGQPVEVAVDALPDELLSGTVVDIATLSTVSTAGDTLYEVNILLDDVGDLPLRWGMTAFVDIRVQE